MRFASWFRGRTGVKNGRSFRHLGSIYPATTTPIGAHPTFDIELVKAGLFGSEGAQAYTTHGATTTHSWMDLGAGVYHLVFDSTNDEIQCALTGSVTVTIMP